MEKDELRFYKKYIIPKLGIDPTIDLKLIMMFIKFIRLKAKYLGTYDEEDFDLLISEEEYETMQELHKYLGSNLRPIKLI